MSATIIPKLFKKSGFYNLLKFNMIPYFIVQILFQISPSKHKISLREYIDF